MAPARVQAARRCRAHLLVSEYLQEVVGHREARSLAVDADDGAGCLAVGAVLTEDDSLILLDVAQFFGPEAVPTQDLPRSLAVDAFKSILDLRLFDQRGADGAEDADGAAYEAVDRV